MDIYENKVVNGVSQCKLKAIASSFISRVFHSVHSLRGHSVLVPYKKDSALPPITRAMELPNLADGNLAESLTGARFNGKALEDLQLQIRSRLRRRRDRGRRRWDGWSHHWPLPYFHKCPFRLLGHSKRCGDFRWGCFLCLGQRIRGGYQVGVLC